MIRTAKAPGFTRVAKPRAESSGPKRLAKRRTRSKASGRIFRLEASCDVNLSLLAAVNSDIGGDAFPHFIGFRHFLFLVDPRFRRGFARKAGGATMPVPKPVYLDGKSGVGLKNDAVDGFCHMVSPIRFSHAQRK